jgi:hypothetical protein
MGIDDKESDDRRIAAIMAIAESLATDDVQDGYSQAGPVTSDAFRFKWTARELEDGRFVVDETIGGGTVAVSSRPMPKEAVQAYIEDRQRQIEAKIENTKRELDSLQSLGLPPAAMPAPSPPAVEEAPDPLQMFDKIRQLLKDSK